MSSTTLPDTSTILSLQNGKVSLSMDLFGGAITDFQLLEQPLNPLSFKFSREQMPENNRAGAPYQGHFICLGRWGEPTEGERKRGMPNHGQFANMLWQLEESSGRAEICTTATAPLEGLQLHRSLLLDAESAVFAVEEKVTNTSSLSRPYNMVQHPTLSSPFLDAHTQVDCNAGAGFNQCFSTNANKYALEWPLGFTEEATMVNVSVPDKAYNAVFTYVVDKGSPLGWITAYSPTHKLLLGYLWKREDYPWIHLWQHWIGNHIKYRGIEFGTAGIHKPFVEILNTAPRIFAENTLAYIDAGETVCRRYLSFLLKVEEGYAGVQSVALAGGKIHISGKQSLQQHAIPTGFNNFL